MSGQTKSRRKMLQLVGALGAVGLAGCTGDDDEPVTDDDDDEPVTDDDDEPVADDDDEPVADDDDDEPVADDDDDEPAEMVSIDSATSVEGSTAFRIASTAGEFIRAQNLTDMFELNAQVAPGATGGYRMLTEREVHMANPSTFSLDVSPDGGPFEDDPLQNFDEVRQVRGLYNVQPFLIVPEEGGIETWEDLEGQTVSFGSAGAATRVPSETMVDIAVGLENVNREYVGYADQPSALRGGRVDAIFGYTNNDILTPGWMQELDASVDWTHIPYTDEMMAEFEELLPFTATRELDGADFFESYTDRLTVYNLDYVQSVLAEMDSDVMYEYARVTYEHGEEFFEHDEALGFFPEPDFFLGGAHPDIPFHEGAYEYYVDEGLWDDYDLTEPPEA